jgi:MgtC family protein/uncharacterized protein DUF4956
VSRPRVAALVAACVLALAAVNASAKNKTPRDPASEETSSQQTPSQQTAPQQTPSQGSPFPQTPAPDTSPHDTLSIGTMDDMAKTLMDELKGAAVRLPVATALGAALALRPRRRGTPRRHPAVVETQIVLAIVGAVIMLVVGSSLARAFGIVGAANLIRYRSKIDDPKDAVVMLSTLAVGLSSGVGLFALAIFSTVFLVAVLWVIEGFETRLRVFELSVKLGAKTSELRSRIEAVLRRFEARYELRASSEGELHYLVMAPMEMRTARVSNDLAALGSPGEAAVEWKEKPKAEATQLAGM